MRLYAIVFTVIFGSVFCLHHVPKRVVNGVPLDGRPATYTGIRYYGVMTTVHSNPIVRKIFALFGVNGFVQCSAMLITPKIIQTACHCLVAYYKQHVKYVDLEPAVVENSWEGKYLIYFGVSNKNGDDSWETTTPVLSTKFVLHEKCARTKGGKYQLITYDFAIIQIPYDWWKSDDTIPYAWTEFESAPQYTARTIMKFYFYALQKQLVCFHCGYGAYDKGKSYPKSDVLRTGWAVLLPQNKCLKEFRAIEIPKQESYPWSCSRDFPQHHQGSGPGDSGGPITCDNKLFAIALGGMPGNIDPNMLLNLYSPIYFDLFINAIEYRGDLMFAIDDLVKTYKDQVYDYYKTEEETKFILNYEVQPSPSSVVLNNISCSPALMMAWIYLL